MMKMKEMVKRTALITATAMLLTAMPVSSGNADHVYNSYTAYASTAEAGLASASDAEQKQGWIKEDGKLFYYVDGKAVKGWKTIEGKKYFFSRKDSAALTGLVYINGSRYYFDTKTHVMKTGLVNVDGHKMYFSTETGAAVKSMMVKSGGRQYYIASSGRAVTDKLITYNNKKYYADENGVILKSSFKTIKNNTYYFNYVGRAVTGLNKIGGYYFYFDSNNVMKKSAWINIDNGRYYFANDGRACTGFQKISGYTFYFGKNGRMVKGKFVKISGKTYYFNDSGKMYTGMHKVAGYKYYMNFSSKGYLTGGVRKLDGKTYRFKSNGRPYSGWYTTAKGNKQYYRQDGTMVTGYKKLGKDYYYFARNGVMYRNKWAYVNGYKFYFDKNGKRLTNVESVIGPQASYEIRVNKTTNVVTIYAKDGNKGYTIPVKAFVCSGGDSTPVGTFYIPARWRWLSLVGNCYGQWNTLITYNESILFHSVYYDQVDANTLSVDAYNQLGTTCSHGCIRLPARDAKWIYDNCANGTKVVIFESKAAGPFPKPTSYKLDSSHTWDPTDPNMAYKCKERGCH